MNKKDDKTSEEPSSSPHKLSSIDYEELRQKLCVENEFLNLSRKMAKNNYNAIEISKGLHEALRIGELLKNSVTGDSVSTRLLSDFQRSIRLPKTALAESNLETEISKLRTEISDKTKALQDQKLDSEKLNEQLNRLKQDYSSLREKESLAYLLSRVGDVGKGKLLSDPKFRGKFSNGEPCDAFVLSIDIRRSTELMLKAKEPKLFAKFIIELASELKSTILDNFGVFDKFTGDGVLGYFPTFYSGVDSGFYCTKAALLCHDIFNFHYEKHHEIFLSVPLDTGLGIGIDYGQVSIVEVGGDITVVGAPVVYACRMSGTAPGTILVNSQAYNKLFNSYNLFDFIRSKLLVKHEGETLAYTLVNNGRSHSPCQPPWLSDEDTNEKGI